MKQLFTTLLIAATGMQLIPTVGINAATAPRPLRGYLIYSDEWKNMSVRENYSIINLMPYDKDAPYYEMRPDGSPQCGTMVGDQYYVCEYDDFSDIVEGLYYIDYVSYDPFTMSEQSRISTHEYGLLSSAMAWDEATNTLWAVTFSDQTKKPELSKLRIENKTVSKEVVAPLAVEKCYAMAIDTDGTLYMIDSKNDLYIIEKSNGSVSLVGNTGENNSNISGATIHPQTGEMYWSVSNSSGSKLCEIDKSTGKATELETYPDNKILTGLFVNPEKKDDEEEYEPVAPATPEPQAQYMADENNIWVFWWAITDGIDGSKLDPKEVSYTVVRQPGNEVIAKNIEGHYWFDPVNPNGEGLKKFSYEVTAHYKGLNSAIGKSNTVCVGNLTLPYLNAFTTGLDEFSVINCNEDRYEWEAKDGIAQLRSNSQQKSDDWIFTMPVYLEKDKAYKVGMDAWCMNGFTERVEIKGTTSLDPSSYDAKIEIVAPTEVTAFEEAPQEVSGYIVPSESGYYRIGIHGISDKNMIALCIDNFYIREGSETAVPKCVTNLSAEVHPKLKSVNIKFEAPIEDVANRKLESLRYIDLKRDDVVVNRFENPVPGEPLSYLDVTPKVADYTYSVIAYNDGGAGEMSTIDVYSGINYPLSPENLSVDESKEGYASLRWDDVTLDTSGNSLVGEDVSYNVYANTGLEILQVAGGLTKPEFTYQAAKEGEQKYIKFEVRAITDRGEGEGVKSESRVYGTPYTGLHESFAGGKLNYVWHADQDGGIWNECNDQTLGISSQDHDNGMLALNGMAMGDLGSLQSGKISLKNMQEPTLSFYTYNVGTNESSGHDNNIIEIFVGEPGEPLKRIRAVTPYVLSEAGEWGECKVPLSEFSDKVVLVKLTLTIMTHPLILIDNISVADATTGGISAPISDSEPLSIYDIDGRYYGKSTLKEFSVSNLPKGVYILKGSEKSVRVLK